MTEIRRALADSFKELMREKSFQKIIVKDITDRAHVKRPTFYTYFRDKYEVAEWIFEQEVWNPAKSLITAGYTKEGLRFMLISMEKEKDFYRKLTSLGGQNSFEEIFRRYIREEVCRALERDSFDSPHRLLSAGVIADYLAGTFWFIIEKWLNYGEDISAREVMEAYDILMSDSVAAMVWKRLEQ